MLQFQIWLAWIKEKFWRSPRIDVSRVDHVPHDGADIVDLKTAADEDVAIDFKPKRKRRSGYKVLEPLRRDLESTVINIIERVDKLNLLTNSSDSLRDEIENALSYLGGCDFHLWGHDISTQMSGGSKYLNPKDQSREFAEVIWPIDVAYVTERDDGSLAFSRVWTADYATLRGRVKFVPQKCVWHSYLSLEANGEWWADLSPVGLVGNRWTYLDTGILRVETDSMKGMLRTGRAASPPDEADNIVAAAFSVALTERYHWHVAFGNETAKSMRVLLPTNPLGCLAMFKTREKRPDETRRAALRHWVTNFYREHGDRDIAFVRDHLRGSTLFNWRGFDCEILVSQFDLEKNESFKTQADEWRAQRKHNRVRVKLKRKANIVS
jgi:hypothetical protein